MLHYKIFNDTSQESIYHLFIFTSSKDLNRSVRVSEREREMGVESKRERKRERDEAIGKKLKINRLKDDIKYIKAYWGDIC